MFEKNNKIMCIFFALIILLVGCGNTQFEKDYNEFKISYLKATDMIDLNDSMITLSRAK